MDDVDWEKIRIFWKFLKIFYNATLRFSGANYVTSNSFFLELMSSDFYVFFIFCL